MNKEEKIKEFYQRMAEKMVACAKEEVELLFPEADPAAKQIAVEVFTNEMWLKIRVKHLEDSLRRILKRKGVR